MKESSFKFSKPILEVLSYSENHDYEISELKDQQIPIDVGIDVNLNDKDCNAIVKIVLRVESENFPYNIMIVMSTNVKWEESVPAEMVENILNKNIPATLLSYARPIISLITSYSNYRQFDLPFLDLRD